MPAGFPDESYPGFDAPIVVKSHQTGRVACGLAKFGLIPAWAKDDKIARHTYNARSETAAEKPNYRTAWRHRQYGLVLVDNFYEPHYESGRAVRWRIDLASGDPFGIACLWDRWTDSATGELVVSFSMLTVNADEKIPSEPGALLWGGQDAGADGMGGAGRQPAQGVEKAAKRAAAAVCWQ